MRDIFLGGKFFFQENFYLAIFLLIAYSKRSMKYTTNEVAARVGLTRQRVAQLIQEGRINAERYGRVWVIDEDQISVIENLPENRGKYPRNKKRALPISS
jgi:excisionase family DNA binding protein